MSPESALARAVFAQTVADISGVDPREARIASTWLYDADPEVDAWRADLADLADVDLGALRRACETAPRPALRKIARLLDKGGRW